MARSRATARKPTPQQAASITSPVQIGGAPGIPGSAIPAIPAKTQKLRARLTDEYVSAGGYLAYVAYARALPDPIDDLATDLGADIYSRMLLDPHVSSMINVLRSSVLEDGVTFQPAITDEADPQHEQAKTMADWCTKVFNRIVPTMDVMLWDMCEAFAQGNRVAELVWDVAPDPHTKRPALLLKSIKTKPRENVAFVVDSYNNLLGLLAVEVGRAYPIQNNIYVTDLDKIPNLLPVEKFCVLTFRQKDGDPRGTTPLRQAYDPWWLAKQSRSEQLKYISTFATPSMIGTTPEDAEPQTEDALGTPLDPSAVISPETAQSTALATLRNATVVSLPHGSEVKLLEPKGNGEAFEAFEDRQDRRIAIAILNNTLSMMEGRHQTRASSGTHQDITDTIVRQIRRIVEQMLADQVVRLLVLFNFGEDALELAPKPQLGRTEQHDFSSMAGGIASLQSSGFLGESQKAGIDAMLNLPTRDMEADAQTALDALAMAQAMVQADPNNPAAKGAMRTEGREAAGGQVAADEAAGQKKGTVKVPATGRNTVTGAPVPKARPDKPQFNPGSQSGVPPNT